MNKIDREEVERNMSSTSDGWVWAMYNELKNKKNKTLDEEEFFIMLDGEIQRRNVMYWTKDNVQSILDDNNK